MARQYTGQKESKSTQMTLTNGTAIYMRVSTDGQAEEGHSLDAQRHKLQAYCEAHGWHVSDDHMYQDAGITGTSTDKREAFKAMMAEAKAGGVTRIVAVKLDRLARNVRDFLATVDELAAVGCDLVLIQESFDTGTPSGKFALTMFAAMAEMEAATITERVMSGKVENAHKGGWNGGRIPYGYSVDAEGCWNVDTAQAGVVRDVFGRFVGGDSMTGIADALNATETPTQRNGKWYAKTVSKILANGTYAGLRQWNTKDGDVNVEVKADDLPSIIGVDTYERAQARLATQRRGRRSTS